jgi:Holliday junction resolvase
MTNPSKAKGTRFESEVVEYLQTQGAPHAERRALAGTLDKGDITGLGPGIVIECKAHKTMALAGWVDETLQEMANAAATVGVTVHKRRGTHARKSYATLQLDVLCHLLREAGYLGEVA